MSHDKGLAATLEGKPIPFLVSIEQFLANAGLVPADYSSYTFLAVVTETDPDMIADIAGDFMDVLVTLGKMWSRVIDEANATYRAKGVIR